METAEDPLIAAMKLQVAAKFNAIATELIQMERQKRAVHETVDYVSGLFEPDGDIAQSISILIELMTLLIEGKPLPDQFAFAAWRALAEQAQLEVVRAAMVIDDAKRRIGGGKEKQNENDSAGV
jgi:hypothetical protein